jgi:hypothetical protein
MNWIKCSERMPERDQVVLCFTKFKTPKILIWFTLSSPSPCWVEDYRVWYGCDGVITHWVPIDYPNDIP